MGNNLSDDEESCDITRKAIIPFRVRNNGFQVDYKIFKFRSIAKVKVDRATDTKYDDSFLELNTRSKIVGDIRKVLTISAETISEEYSTLRKNYYSRILFAILTFFIGVVLTNIGLVQNELPKGRIMIIFGGMLLILTMITLIIVIYTDRRLKTLNKEFVRSCVKILEKEKIVTWTASFQHLLFDIIYPYTGRAGTGAVILTPNPYFEMLKTTDEVIDIDIDVNNPANNDKKTRKLKLPIPQWAIDESISEGPNEEAPLIKNDKSKKKFERSLIVVPSDDNYDEEIKHNGHGLLVPISAAEQTSSDDSEAEADDNELLKGSDADVEDMDMEEDNNELCVGVNKKNKVKIKAYIPFDDSKENIAKIHGSLIQGFFHENPEDIEGHGEDTAFLENKIALEAAAVNAAK